jgi:hypothetical protein
MDSVKMMETVDWILIFNAMGPFANINTRPVMAAGTKVSGFGFEHSAFGMGRKQTGVIIHEHLRDSG